MTNMSHPKPSFGQHMGQTRRESIETGCIGNVLNSCEDETKGQQILHEIQMSKESQDDKQVGII